MTTRAKFRCMSATLHSHGNVTFRLLPVLDSSPENHEFWKATPSGEIEVNGGQGWTFTHFIPNNCYFVDLTPDPEGDWVLDTLTETGTTLQVAFSVPWSHTHPMSLSKFEMSVDNRDAWPNFQGHVGERFAVDFTPAPEHK